MCGSRQSQLVKVNFLLALLLNGYLADGGATVERMRLLSADEAMLWLRDRVEM
jgi:hypothetical protein